MRPLSGPIFVAFGLALSGCAAMYGSTDALTVNSEPAGAACRVERMAEPVAQIKETPAVVMVPRSHYPIDIYCTKDGIAGAETVWPGVNPLVYGDLVFGGVPYMVDTLSDADRTLPDSVVVRFPVAGQ
jgi:hypothetical protein